MAKKDRIMIFIDHNNILHIFMKNDSFRFDYLKLREIISQGRDVVSTRTYMGLEPLRNPNAKSRRKGFFEFLRRHNIEPITARVKIARDGTRKEKEIDVKLATDMLSSAYEDLYDKCVLLSGDGDFKPVIEKIISLGKKVEVWSFRDAISSRLSDIVLYRNLFYLDEYLEELKL